jgi:hypothetical protein
MDELVALSRWCRFVVQIADGENGGVMMNEFPPKYMNAVPCRW